MITEPRANGGPRLVPDSGEFAELIRQVVDVLEHLEDYKHAWVLPEPLADSVALGAIERIHDVLRPAVGSFRDPDNPPGPRVLGPDGRYEHLPFRVVMLDPADLNTLAEALRVTSRALSADDRAGETNPWAQQRLRHLAEALGEFTPGRSPRALDRYAELRTPEDFLRPLSRLVAVLDMPVDDDTTTMLDALAVGPTAGDLVLTDPQEEAYQRLAGRFNVLVSDGSGTTRFEW